MRDPWLRAAVGPAWSAITCRQRWIGIVSPSVRQRTKDYSDRSSNHSEKNGANATQHPFLLFIEPISFEPTGNAILLYTLR